MRRWGVMWSVLRAFKMRRAALFWTFWSLFTRYVALFTMECKINSVRKLTTLQDRTRHYVGKNCRIETAVEIDAHDVEIDWNGTIWSKQHVEMNNAAIQRKTLYGGKKSVWHEPHVEIDLTLVSRRKDWNRLSAESALIFRAPGRSSRSRLVSKLVFWAQLTTKDYIRAKNSVQSVSYLSAWKPSNHKLSKNCKMSPDMTQVYRKHTQISNTKFLKN